MKNKKEYSLLFSSPGDVVREGIYKAFKKEIEEMNQDFFALFGIKINLVQWHEDAIPDSAKAPQPSINRQLVDRCQFGVAIFHNRFGTPTDSYGSGTEEEIALLKKQGKPVFIYFMTQSRCLFRDRRQQDEVNAFKAKIEKESFVWEVPNREKLLTQFKAHFKKKFANFLNEGEGFSFCDSFNPSERPTIRPYSDICSPFLEGKKKAIAEKIEELKKDQLPPPPPVPSHVSSGRYGVVPGYMPPSLFAVPSDYEEKHYAGLSDYEKELIIDFSKENGILLSGDFFNLGRLQIRTSLHLTDSDPHLEGDEEGEKRYKSLMGLASQILSYKDWVTFLEPLSKLWFLSLAIRSLAHEPDSMVTIKLVVPVTSFFDPKTIGFPGTFISDEVIARLEDLGFSQKDGPEVLAYPFYPPASFSPYNGIPDSLLRNEQKEEMAESEFYNELETKFCEDTIQKGEKIYLTIEYPQFMQNTTVAFPSIIFFTGPLKEIAYSINSANTPNPIEGELTLFVDADAR